MILKQNHFSATNHILKTDLFIWKSRFQRKRTGKREREREISPIYRVSFQMGTTARAGPAQSQEVHPGLPYERQGPGACGIFLCFFQAIIREMIRNGTARAWTHGCMGCWHREQQLNLLHGNTSTNKLHFLEQCEFVHRNSQSLIIWAFSCAHSNCANLAPDVIVINETDLLSQLSTCLPGHATSFCYFSKIEQPKIVMLCKIPSKIVFLVLKSSSSCCLLSTWTAEFAPCHTHAYENDRKMRVVNNFKVRPYNSEFVGSSWLGLNHTWRYFSLHFSRQKKVW